MEKNAGAAGLRPHLILCALIGLATLAMAFATEVRFTGETGVRTVMPARLGAWYGSPILYCLNRPCQRSYRLDQLADPALCPNCGKKLSTGALAEWDLLPADTEIHKMAYTNAAGRMLLVSLVISGASRTSLHRPQICLVVGGTEIVATHSSSVPRPGRRPLKITTLDLLRRGKQDDGSWAAAYSFYSYWYVGPRRQTPSHLVRMFWMALDRIFLGRADRWAYISVAGTRLPDSRDHLQLAAEFIRELYPQIVLHP